jgi:hypothetical protein
VTKPVAPAKGIAFAFPDVCLTPGPPLVPIPYPNVAQLTDADPVSDESGKALRVGPAGDPVLLRGSRVGTSTGNEAATEGVRSGGIKGDCELVQASGSVLYGSEGRGLVRFLDRTDQNIGPRGPNASGMVLSAFPTVQVGD